MATASTTDTTSSPLSAVQFATQGAASGGPALGTVDTSQPNPNTVTAGLQNTSPTSNLTKVATQGIGPDGKPIYDVFAGQEHIADPNDPRLKGVDIASLPTGTAPSKFESAFNTTKAAGTTSPTSLGDGSALVNNNIAQDNSNTQADTVIAADRAHQQYLTDYAASLSSANQQQTLLQQYQDMSKQLGIPALNTQLINMKNVIDGTEQDIRDEVTKAGGFATDSQVLALTNARNKSMIQNYNNLLQTRTDMQNNLTTMIGLSEKDRAYASAQIDKQLNFDQQEMQYADKMLKNAQDSLANSAKTMGWEGILKSALATGDPQAVARINSTMGNGFDLAQAAQQEKDAKTVSNLKTTLENQKLQGDIALNTAQIAKTKADTAQIYSNMGGKTNIGITVPITDGNGKTSYVPINLAPYYNVSNSGVEYIDASALEGTAAQKRDLVNEATKAGYKVITNKNTAADLINIKDANSKLDSISTTMAGIGQPGWVSRLAGGLGLTWLETATQSNPQKAAAGALQAVGLDILKAISGVQGFRGNQSAVQQVTEHLPKITDTVDTINQKIAYIRQLISDREDAAVGKPKVEVVPINQIPAGYYQASDGLFYPKR